MKRTADINEILKPLKRLSNNQKLGSLYFIHKI